MKIDPHAKPLDTIHAKASMALLLMLFRHDNAKNIEILDATIRAVRRRWDLLVPPAIADRKALHADLVKERSKWDSWMNRFLNGTVTIGELEEMIVACNSASRVGVVCDPVPSFVASIKIGTSPNEIAKAPKDNDDAENDKQRIDVPSALNEIDVKMRELAKERRRLMDRQQPDLPPPPAPSDLLADLPPAYNDPNVDHD